MSKKKTTQTVKQERTSGSGRKKVWHITDFAPLYELADDLRKERSGPLRYTKSLVTLSPFCPDAESRHFERMRRLKARPERHLLRSIFEDLKNWTGSKPYSLRGYFITAESKAASNDYLAEQLGVSVDEIEKALPVLEQLGFIERVPMNGQAEPKKPKGKNSNKKKSKTGSTKTTKKQGKKNGQKNSGKSKTTAKRTAERSTKGAPESAGLKRKACARLRVKNKDKYKGNYKVKNKGKATIGLTASGCKEKYNDNSAENKVKAQSKGRSQGQVEPPTTPATTPPMPSMPQESDDGGRVTSFARPPDSVEISRHGLAYGRRIYLALGYRHDIDGPEAAREIGSFASKHDTVCSQLSGMSPTVVDIVLSRGLREAAKIAKRPANKSRGAVWHFVMDKLAAAQRSPP